MISLATFTTPPHECGYLPDRQSTMEYEWVQELSSEEFGVKVELGWRKFGQALFRPVCEGCKACQSMRVPVASFVPNRSQKRAWAANEDVTLVISEPEISEETLNLYDRFHAYRTDSRGWERHDTNDALHYAESFVFGPCPPEEWRYYVESKLIGVGYVDRVPGALSAVYFFYDPDERHRSLGTWNVLKILDHAKAKQLDTVYLGYYVSGCGSLEYKSKFRPNQVRNEENGLWVPFRP